MKVRIRPHFVIRWVKAGRIDPEFSVLRNPVLLRACGVYLIFSGKRKIQYIGITCNQSLAQRVGQHLRGLQRVGASFPQDGYLFVGLVIPRAYKALSARMLEEIESFLIWAIKPEGNIAKRRPYKGREMLIENDGDEFGLPRFLYEGQLGPLVRVGQGPSPDQMTFRTIGPSGWQR